MIPISWTERSISGAERLTDRELVDAIDAGARVVVLDMVVTVLLSYLTNRGMYLVRPGERPPRLPTTVTLLLGWWGIALPRALLGLWRNLTGGVDVTAEVRAERAATAAAEAESARLLVEAREARAHGGAASTEARRVAAIELLQAGKLEDAWLEVGADVETDRGAQRDLPLLRGLVTGLHDARAWPRAARVAAVLRREFPEEARAGYLAFTLRTIDRHGHEPEGFDPPPPYWQTTPGILRLGACVASLGLLGASLYNLWVEGHRDLWVVNGTRDDVTVAIPGGAPPTVTVQAGGRTRVVVAEGAVRATVVRRGAPNDHLFSVRTGYLQRFWRSVFVLDVEGAAALVREQRASVGPRARAPTLDPRQVWFGEPFYAFHDVTTAFAPFGPVRAAHERDVEVETRIDVLVGPPHQVARAFPDPARGLDFLELHLRLAPDDFAQAESYVAYATLVKARPRAEAFLERLRAGR